VLLRINSGMNYTRTYMVNFSSVQREFLLQVDMVPIFEASLEIESGSVDLEVKATRIRGLFPRSAFLISGRSWTWMSEMTSSVSLLGDSYRVSSYH